MSEPSPTPIAIDGTVRESTITALTAARFAVGYFVRRRLVLAAALMSAAAEAAVLTQRGMQWRGDVIWTVDWLAVSFIVVGPVVAGLSAMDTARTARGTLHYFRGPVARTPSAAVVIAYTVVVGATHLACLAIALVISAPRVGDPFVGMAILAQVLMITYFSAVGTLVGRFARPVLAGLGGALVAYLSVLAFGAASTRVGLLDTGGATLPRVGYAYSPAYLIAQCLALGAVTLATLWLRPFEETPRRVARRDLAACVAALLVVLGTSSLGPSSRLTQVDALPTYCGTVIEVQTCFYVQHARVAPLFQEPLWAMVSSAERKGYTSLLPRRVEEASRTRLPQAQSPDVGAVYVQPDHLRGIPPTFVELALGLAQPIHCRQVQGDMPPSEKYWDDLGVLVATWLNLVMSPDEAADAGYPQQPLSPADADALSRQFRTCTYAHF